MDQLSLAFIKAIPTAVLAFITLGLGWLVSTRVTYRWDLRKKQSELSLDAVHRFYSVYGEFFAVWKLWEAMDPSKESFMDSKREDTRLRLLERAAGNEGMFESLIVKLAAERRLNHEDLEHLANFREGLQCLRESIEDKVALRTHNGDGKEWMSRTKEGKPERARAYRSFKALAVFVSALATQRKFRKGKEAKAPLGMIEATSTERRDTWWQQGLQ